VEIGLTQIYTGDGKGKTTAVAGMLLRSLAAGYKVVVFQFLKGSKSGEIVMLEKLGVEVHLFNSQNKFTWSMTVAELDLLKQEVAHGLANARQCLKNGEYDIVFCDEIINALTRGFIETRDLLDLIQVKSSNTELIMTGRNAPDELIEKANLVSEIKAVKHPFEKGIPSRRGIED